jgi:hypothetical protein
MREYHAEASLLPCATEYFNETIPEALLTVIRESRVCYARNPLRLPGIDRALFICPEIQIIVVCGHKSQDWAWCTFVYTPTTVGEKVAFSKILTMIFLIAQS